MSRVRGVPWESGAGKPGIKQANMQSCSRAAFLCSACIHSRKRRTPSRRIYTREKKREEKPNQYMPLDAFSRVKINEIRKTLEDWDPRARRER